MKPAAEKKARTDPMPDSVANGRAAWVLVVDDDAANRQLQRIALSFEGLRVREAASGFEALGILGDCNHPFGLVLTDYEMPGMTGAELAAAIRRTGAAMPIVLVTAQDSVTEEHTRRWGFQALIRKPYAIDLFLRTVRELLWGAEG